MVTIARLATVKANCNDATQIALTYGTTKRSTVRSATAKEGVMVTIARLATVKANCNDASGIALTQENTAIDVGTSRHS